MYSDFLADAKTFIEVIKLGSISALSEKSGEHRKTISKRISRIEEYFSSKLIKIDKGKIQLTSEGKSIFINLKNIVRGLDHKVKSLAKSTSKFKHHIKFLNSADMYISYGPQIISSLLSKNPLLSIEAKVYTQYQLTNFGIILKDLIEDSDIVVLWENLLHLIDDQKWILRKRLSTKKNIYASPKYIENNPNVKDISDIHMHSCIINNYEEYGYWNLQDKLGNTHKIDINVTAAVDTLNFQLKLIENHLGIGLLSESIVNSSSTNIQQIFTGFSSDRRTSCLLINKASLDKKPILKNITKEISNLLDSMDFWS